MMFNQITNLYVMPEIKKRRDEEKLSNEFRVKQCLIKLPRNREPIVLFNDEVSAIAHLVGCVPYLTQPLLLSR